MYVLGVLVKGFLALLNELNKKFENIQKNLNQFLIKLYFLSMVDRISAVEDISGRSRYNKCEELFCAGKPG